MRANLLIRRFIAPVLVASLAMLVLPTESGASAISSHSVPGLKHCAKSRSCDIKNANLHFVNYSSVCNYSDCNFVAAANWEKIALHTQPPASLIKSEYKAAHQTFSGGLHMPDLWLYWKQSGIDGAYATKVTVWSHSQGAVQNGILDFGSMISQLAVSNKSALSNQFGVYGTVLVTVDGFDPIGPLVVFKTKTMQATWAQWKSSVRAVWGISTSTNPPTPPPTTTTTVVPPTTTTTVVQTASVTFSANGGSGVMANETETVGTAVSLIPNVFAYSGYSFNDWNTAPNGGGTSYANGAIYPFATSVTLYAQWTATTPPVTFTGMVSSNWSGYMLPSSSALFTDVSAQWTVPTLNCADTPNNKSTPWVGIGGVTWPTGGSSGQLLQTGTEDDCVNGVQQDYGWWELYPVNFQQPFYNYTVSPGNSMQAYVYQDTNGAWVTLLNNLTTGLSGVMVTGEGWGVAPTPASGSPPFSYQGTTTGWTYAGGYSAEWIVEDTGNASGGTYPFANYGSVTFFNLTTSLSPWYLTSSDEVELVQNGVTLSAPSPINSNGGFTVTYMGP